MQQLADGTAYLLNLELDSIRLKVRAALENLDNLSRRDYVKGELEAAISRLSDLCEMTGHDQ